MGFVNSHSIINQNTLGILKAGGLKNRKSINIMTNNFYNFSLLLFFNICSLLLIFN